MSEKVSGHISPGGMALILWNRMRKGAIGETETRIKQLETASESVKAYWLEVKAALLEKAAGVA